MHRHIIQWTAPAPLWPGLIATGTVRRTAGFGVPAILRFASDNFMQDFLDALATDPRKVGEFRAVPETWRGRQLAPTIPSPARSFALGLQRLGHKNRRTPTTGAKAAPSADTAALPRLKLYQPAHQRFYLVSACLVCESPGLPDRKIDTGRQESVSFVLRRLLPPLPVLDPLPPVSSWQEHAWVNTPDGFIWEKVAADGRTNTQPLVPREERLPLFPLSFQEDDQRTRRLVAGNIPVARREAYLGAQRRSAVPAPAAPGATPLRPGATDKTARKILLRQQVIEPWKALVAQAKKVMTLLAEPAPTSPLNKDRQKAFQASREQIQTVSWLVLLDLAEFLQAHLPDLWRAVVTGTPPDPAAAGGHLAAAYTILNGASLGPALQAALLVHTDQVSGNPAPIYVAADIPGNLRAALALYGRSPDLALEPNLQRKLENVDQPYDRGSSASRALWPGFVFPLADPEHDTDAPLAAGLSTITLEPDEELDLGELPADPLDELAVALIRAMPAAAASPQPEIPAAALEAADPFTGIFVIRCIYERPACGPLHEDVVSEPTEPFDLAGFFDPDAPARPIRIGLPIDTTPAGLRKFNKNTAFVMSDVLCGQVNRMKGITFGDLIRSVLPFPLHKDLPSGEGGPCKKSDQLGTICSISIPIVTICALILLIIMVSILDYIFKWLPFFICCFPIPGLKAKKPSPA